MIDQSSVSLFSIGVPVRATLNAALSRLMLRACFVDGFLMFCASSKTTPDHSTWLSILLSLVARAYVVITRSWALASAANSFPVDRSAPWWTMTLRDGANRCVSRCQL